MYEKPEAWRFTLSIPKIVDYPHLAFLTVDSLVEILSLPVLEYVLYSKLAKKNVRRQAGQMFIWKFEGNDWVIPIEFSIG